MFSFIEIRKAKVMVAAMISSLLLLSISLISLSVMADPVITGKVNGIVIDTSCPNGEEVCPHHPIDCLGGCALNATTGATEFEWDRTILEAIPDKSSRADIQAMKKCLNGNAVRDALLKAQPQAPETGAVKLPCTVTGSTWQYIYPKYTVSALTKETCDKTRSFLEELTNSCQDWKNSASEIALWIAYALAGFVGAGTIYFTVAQIGSATGLFYWFTLGDGISWCYQAVYN